MDAERAAKAEAWMKDALKKEVEEETLRIAPRVAENKKQLAALEEARLKARLKAR